MKGRLYILSKNPFNSPGLQLVIRAILVISVILVILVISVISVILVILVIYVISVISVILVPQTDLTTRAVVVKPSNHLAKLSRYPDLKWYARDWSRFDKIGGLKW